MEHIGSVRDDAELKAAARPLMAAASPSWPAGPTG
jgi:hypothetical protein